MTKGTIFQVDKEGGLSRMTPSAPASEDVMQVLVAKYPELITDGDGELLLIRREKPVADSFDSSGRWALDHLFVTRNAIPVLVELKRASNSQLRREVVGQMMDYAANASAYWRTGHIRETFASTCKSEGGEPEIELQEFIGDREPESFWSEVDRNVESGRMKLVFVADVITRELAQIVEFLNSQMKADVRAIELKWFTGDNGITALVPRVIGETETAVARKSDPAQIEALPLDAWIEKNIRPLGEEAVRGAFAYVEAMEIIGCRNEVGSAQGSIRAVSVGDNGKPFYPFNLWANGVMSLSYQYLLNRRGLTDEVTRKNFIDDFAGILGPPNSQNNRGFPGFRVETLANPGVKSEFISAARNFIAAARLA